MDSIYFSTFEMGPHNDNLVTDPVKATGGVFGGGDCFDGTASVWHGTRKLFKCDPWKLLENGSNHTVFYHFFRAFIDLSYSERDHRDARLGFLFMEVLTPRAIYGQWLGT